MPTHFDGYDVNVYVNTTHAADWPKLRASGDTGRLDMLEAINTVTAADGYLADIKTAFDALEALLP